LTGVVPDRQKIVFKGKTLKDDWEGFKIEDGSLIMLLGTVSEAPKKLTDEPMEVENKDRYIEEKKLNLPAGLNNLGNTCFMNASLQVMKTIPELQTALSLYNADSMEITSKQITMGLKTLFKQMNGAENKAYPPHLFVLQLQHCFPQLATKTPQGMNEQQDANECWNEIMRCLNSELALEGPEKEKISFKRFVEGTHKIELRNTEAEDEVQNSEENFYELSCYLTQEVKYLQSGINKTVEQITKHSTKLGRDAIFEKKTLISRLPGYLCIQLVRFFYKEKEKLNAKILKDVKFPFILDVFDLCTPELKEKLAPNRAAFKEYEDKAVERLRQSKLEEKVEKEEDIKYAPYSFENDPGSNNSGFYELQGIVTHKGRSSNSGHYVGWIKVNKQWIMCDDDEVHPVTEDDVQKLSGGGDWHCAYLLLYGPRRLRID